jgi:hypothetical protein
MATNDLCDFLFLVVARSEVESGDISRILGLLQGLLETAEKAGSFLEKVDIAFQGHDDRKEELFEIMEVRDFVCKIDAQFPFWLFFLSKQCLGLQCLLHCFLPPFLTNEGKSRIFPDRISSLLTYRWLPAMNQVCSFCGMSEQEINALTDRAMEYIAKGRIKPSSSNE